MSLELAPAVDLLRREFPAAAGIYVFGSAADGRRGPDSDVDLAVFAGRALERARILDVQEKAARLLRCDVDLVDLAVAPTILQIQVIGEGRILAAPDESALAAFEVRVMRDYQELKARRADGEADIVRRGRVYA